MIFELMKKKYNSYKKLTWNCYDLNLTHFILNYC